MRKKRKHSDPFSVTKREKETSNTKEWMETVEGIRRGLESMKANRGIPAEKFFADFYDRNDVRGTK